MTAPTSSRASDDTDADLPHLVPAANTGADDPDQSGADSLVPYDDSDVATGPGRKLGDPIEARPYIHISPAREQVTPGNVISGLFGLYRAGVTPTSRFNIMSRLGLKDYDKTFEFIIHKPRRTKRFDFYLSTTPYDSTSFKNLAANVRAMYPESFEFEVVPFNPVAAFATDSGNAQVGGRRIASLEDIDALEQLHGFEAPSVFVDHDIGSGASPPLEEADKVLQGEGVPLCPEAVPQEKRPALVRWEGVPMKKNDWMTLIHPFSDTAVDNDDQYRSPLSVLLEQAVHTTDPFIFQAVFTPRPNWTEEAEVHKRNLKMGNHGMFSAFKNEFMRQVFGTSEQERRNLHQADISEQVGGSVTASDTNKVGGSRMAQIDHKQPTTTFDLSLRAASDAATVQSITNAFTSLSGPYYGIEGEILNHDDREFIRLCHARQSTPRGLSGRLSTGNPIICASPDELANFVVVPHTNALPRASRGSSGGSPDARAPLTATDEDLLSRYDYGMHIGDAETAVDNRSDMPIRLSAEQLTHHVLRAATTGGGKTTAMINDALSAHEAFDGPTFIFDKKGGSMSTEYKRAHFAKFGSLDTVIHVPVPGPDDEVLAFPYFDIRPQLAAGVNRTVAVQEKVDRYNEMLVYVLGREMTSQAFVAQEILNNLIKALFDPKYGRDAWPINDLFEAAFEMQQGQLPDVSDPTLHLSLARHLHADEQRFQTSIDAVMNRITKLAERSFIWRILNFVPEWDHEAGCYAEQSPMFDIQEILDSQSVVLVDTGDLRPASSNLFVFLLLDYIWSGARLHHRRGETPSVSDGYVINLIIDEAAPMLQSELVRDDMIPDGREFGIALEVIVHFAEQVKADALDVAAYKEILRNINTKLIGKLAIDDELIQTLFHEGIEAEELVDRVASLPRGEWIAQLPDTGFMTDIPELVTMLPVDIPDGHSNSDTPVTEDTVSPFGDRFSEIDVEMTRSTRDDYCLLPANNSGPSAEQISVAGDSVDPTSASSSLAPNSRLESGLIENGSDDGSSGGRESLPATQLGSDGSPAVSPTKPNTSRPPDADTSPDGSDEQVDAVTGPVPADDLGTGQPTLPSEEETPGEPLEERVRALLGEGGRPSDSDVPPSGEVQDGKDAATTAVDGDDEGERPAGPGTDENLTVQERHFLTAIVATVNGRHSSFDLLDSMTHIKNQFPDVDVEKLAALGYLEEHSEIRRTYYTVTRAGQRACGAKVATGENQGDVNEKTFHKVMVEALARTIDADPTNNYFVTRYSRLHETDATPDVVAYDDDHPVILGEAITNVHPSLIVKHYDDYDAVDAEQKIWIVPKLTGAWRIVRALANEGRISSVPPKREGKTYEALNAAIWGDDSEWEFVSARKLIHDLD